jgi:putative membrane protein
MSYLDDPRVFFAAERTMLAWQRTAIALIGLGFVIERFGLFMRLLAVGAPQPVASGRTSLVFGVLLLLIGAAVSSVSAVQFRRFIRSLSPAELPPGYPAWFGPVVNHSLAVVAFALSAWFVVAG